MGADTDRADEWHERVPAIDDGSLIVVSNRQPYTHTYEDAEAAENGETEGNDRTIGINRPAGGLTAGLDPVLQRTDGTWIAWVFRRHSYHAIGVGDHLVGVAVAPRDPGAVRAL